MQPLQIAHELISAGIRHHVCMHIGAYQLQLAVIEIESGIQKYSFNKTYSEQIHASFDGPIKELNENWPNAVFQNCTVEVDPTEFTLIPEHLFEAEQERAYFGFEIGGDQVVLHRSQSPLTLVFAIPSKLLLLKSIIIGAEIIPTPQLLLSPHTTEMKQRPTGRVFVRSGKHLIQIEQEGKLVMLSYFPGTALADVLYFLANACIQHHINLSELTVEFHGVIWNSNELNQLKEYIYDAYNWRELERAHLARR
jgi:Protein of unknown function (DUF3822)